MEDPTMANIITLHPSLQYAAWTFVNAVRAAGIPLIIISARRTPLQNRDAGGATSSLHLDQERLTGEPGALAFDVQVMGYTRDELPAQFWAVLGEWAEKNLRLHWGGRFIYAGAPDVNHFDARTWFT